MSKENLEQFMNKVAESEELQYRLDEGGEIDAEALIALGAECGCEFTAEELMVSAAFVTGCIRNINRTRRYTGGGQRGLQYKWLANDQ